MDHPGKDHPHKDHPGKVHHIKGRPHQACNYHPMVPMVVQVRLLAQDLLGSPLVNLDHPGQDLLQQGVHQVVQGGHHPLVHHQVGHLHEDTHPHSDHPHRGHHQGRIIIITK